MSNSETRARQAPLSVGFPSSGLLFPSPGDLPNPGTECEVVSYSGLICISPVTKDVEHLFIYLLAFCILFKYLLKSIAHF